MPAISALASSCPVLVGDHRTTPHKYDEQRYRLRHRVECFIGKLKHYRRAFSRFEQLAKNYAGFLAFLSAVILIR